MTEFLPKVLALFVGPFSKVDQTKRLVCVCSIWFGLLFLSYDCISPSILILNLSKWPFEKAR